MSALGDVGGARVLGGVGGVEEVVDEFWCGLGVGGVGWGDGGGGDQFGVGVHRGVALVAVEASRGALVAVAGVGVHSGQDPVLGHAPSDHEAPAAVLAQVLAGHRGQHLGGLAERAVEFAALERGEHRGRVRAETVHQFLSGPGVVPVAVRLGA